MSRHFLVVSGVKPDVPAIFPNTSLSLTGSGIPAWRDMPVRPPRRAAHPMWRAIGSWRALIEEQNVRL